MKIKILLRLIVPFGYTLKYRCLLKSKKYITKVSNDTGLTFIHCSCRFFFNYAFHPCYESCSLRSPILTLVQYTQRPFLVFNEKNHKGCFFFWLKLELLQLLVLFQRPISLFSLKVIHTIILIPLLGSYTQILLPLWNERKNEKCC